MTAAVPATPKTRGRKTVWTPADVEKASTVKRRGRPPRDTSHGPDAVKFLGQEAPPELVSARLRLNDLLNSKPKPSEETNFLPDPDDLPVALWLVDRYMAMAMLERNKINRKLSERRVDVHAASQQRGEWDAPNAETVKFEWNGWLIDRQHTLNAIVQSGVPVWLYIVWNLDPKVRDRIDLGKARTNADFLQMQEAEKDEEKISSGNFRARAAGARLIIRYEAKNRMSRLEVASPQQIKEAIRRHPLLKEASGKVSQFKKAKLPEGAAVFAWTLAAEFNKEKADEFFSRIIPGHVLEDKNDPVWRLRSYLDNAKRPHADEVAALTIKAWNAFAQGLPVKHLRNLPDEQFPVAITKEMVKAATEKARAGEQKSLELVEPEGVA